MNERRGLLLSCFDYSPVDEEEFHDWYDTEHIPERARVPGFLDCRRWLAVDRPQASVATYDLAGVEVLRTPGYLAIGYENNSPWTRRVGWRCRKLLRFEGEQLVPGNAPGADAASALAIWAFNLAEVDESALVAWWRERSREAPQDDILACRLYRATASTHRYVVLFHLACVETPRTPAWRDRFEQPWAAAFARHEREAFRMLARRYVRHGESSGATPP